VSGWVSKARQYLCRTGRRDRCRAGGSWAALAGLVLLAGGCAEEPLPQRQLRSDDCLQTVQLDQLTEQIRRCDAVVAAFPTNPGPLNDRYLLHSLAGNEAAACTDINRAAALARSKPPASLDPQLRTDLNLRQQLCREGGSKGRPQP
jgi:hypothetical protein